MKSSRKWKKLRKQAVSVIMLLAVLCALAIRGEAAEVEGDLVVGHEGTDSAAEEAISTEEIEARREEIRASYFGVKKAKGRRAAPARAAGSLSMYLEDLGRIAYEGYSTNHFNIDGNIAYCLEPSQPTPADGDYTGTLLAVDSDLRKVMYYSVGSPGEAALYQYWGNEGFWQFPDAFIGGVMPWEDRYAYCHMFQAWVYAGFDWDVAFHGTTVPAQGWYAAAQTDFYDRYNAIMGDLPDAPTGFDAYIVDTGGKSQVMSAWHYTPYGSLDLQKVSADPEITQGNACYSLQGAEYGVYTNRACTNKIGTLTTDAAGNSNAIEVEAGEYFVKEEVAPTGYLLSDEVKAVTVTEGQTATVSFSDVPGNDPAAIRLNKIDKETGETVGQGAASLAGARFEIKYYAGYYTMDTLPADATRTWVIETKERTAGAGNVTYYARLHNDYKVGGDAFYYIEGFDDPVLPLGTITVQEILPPRGYTLQGGFLQGGAGGAVKAEDIYLSQITQNGQLVSLQGGNEYTRTEQIVRGGVKVQKRDLETKGAKAQGKGSLKDTVLKIVSLNDNPVMVEGNVYNKNETVKTLRTGEDGTAATAADLLPYGHYRIEEATPPKGYLAEGILKQEFDIEAEGELVDLTPADKSVSNRIIRGGVKIQKRDLETKEAKAQGKGSLKDAVFKIISLNDNPVMVDGKMYNKNEEVKTIRTDAKGIASTAEDTLPYGRYRIEEIGPPTGYLEQGAVPREFDIEVEGKLVDLTPEDQSISNQIIRGGVKIQKRDLETKEAKAQGEGSLQDAVFKIVSLNDNPVKVDGKMYQKDEAVKTIRTDAKGIASTAEDTLPYGHYRIEEATPPTGYLGEGILEQEFDIEIEGKIVDLTPEEKSISNQIIRGGVKIQKRSLESEEAAPLGGATLEGASFTITSLNDNPVMVDGKMYQKDEIAKTILTDAKGIASTPGDALPYGRYRIEEIEPPEGYLIEGAEPREFEIREDGKVVDMTGKGSSIYNQVKRGDFELTKKDERGAALRYIPFQVTSMTTGEKHIFITDENGYYSSSSDYVEHSRKTNANDEIADGKKPVKDSGMWFGQYKDSGTGEIKITDVNDEKGALPYDTYEVKELRCEANESMSLITFTMTISRNGFALDMGTLTDIDVSLSLSTYATDAMTGTSYALAEEHTDLMDAASFVGLERGEEYTMITTVWDKNEGAQLKDKAGDPITVTTPFTAKANAGTIYSRLILDARGLEGKDIVFGEDIYHGSTLILSHIDLNDEDQTIHFPKITTKALNPKTGINMIGTGEEEEFLDTVSYENMPKGRKIRFQSEVRDAKTGKAVRDADGNAITAEADVITEESSGTAEVSFTINASNLEGRSLVCTEKAYIGNGLVAVEDDLDNEAQTIHVPKLSSEALDAETGSHTGTVGERSVIREKLSYSNVVPGQEIKIVGSVKLADSGETLTLLPPEGEADAGKETEKGILAKIGAFFMGEEEPSTVEITIIPKEESGSVELEFAIDATELAGKTVVVCDEGYIGDVMAMRHDDLTNGAQSIFYPSIGTEALDEKTGSHTAIIDEKQITIDSVAYGNLIEGETYTLKGAPVLKESGEILKDGEGKEIWEEITFIAREGEAEILKDAPEGAKEKEAKDQDPAKLKGVSGKVSLPFTVDTTKLAGQTFVITEYLYSGDTLIAKEDDLANGAQSIFCPSIGTEALDEKTGSHTAIIDEKQATLDSVAYGNLIEGETYTLKGAPVLKESGEILKDGEGKEIWEEITFIAREGEAEILKDPSEGAKEKEAKDEEPAKLKGVSGKVSLPFTVDTAKLAGQTFVITEYLYSGDTLVAKEDDLDNGAQTIHVPKLSSEALDAETGSHTGTVRERSVIREKLSYSNVVPGQEIKIVGSVKLADSGETLTLLPPEGEADAGKETEKGLQEKIGAFFMGEEETSTVEITITPKEESGSVELEFAIDATELAGKTVVVCDEGYIGDVMAMRHDRLDNESQSIFYPYIGTEALDEKTGSHTAIIDEKQITLDSVEYRNLIEGETYTLRGAPVLKESGEILKDGEGKEIWEEITFIAREGEAEILKDASEGAKEKEAKDEEPARIKGVPGKVILPFTVDTTKLAGQTFVITEYLYSGDTLVAKEDDLNNEAQSISVPEEEIPGTPVKTGARSNAAPLLLTGCALLIVGAFLLRKKKEERTKI